MAAMRREDEDRTGPREDFVRALTWLLEERGMSQRELASQLGRATHTPFYRWMELKAEPPPAEVFNIERVLDVPPGMLSIRLGYLPRRREAPRRRRPASRTPSRPTPSSTTRPGGCCGWSTPNSPGSQGNERHGRHRGQGGVEGFGPTPAGQVDLAEVIAQLLAGCECDESFKLLGVH